MLDRETLQSFCEGFYGYGEASAPHWFISMEEGGGASEQEIDTRISTWVSRGRRELEDLNDYHRAINIDKWFSNYPPIQKTWYATIRMLLILAGQSPSIRLARNFQRDHLARKGGSSRLSPLFPLPARSLDHWNYGKWVDVGTYRDRASYRRHFQDLRIKHLAAGIISARPRTVVFYGQSYSEYWQKIAAAQFERTPNGLDVATDVHTRFVICKHPATKGISNEYFDAIGRLLATSQPTRNAELQHGVGIPLLSAKGNNNGDSPMSHLCEQLIEAARYLEKQGMSTDQLSKLHHFSLKGRRATFSEAYRYFGINKDLNKSNINYAERLKFVAAGHKSGQQDFNSLIEQAMSRWPLEH